MIGSVLLAFGFAYLLGSIPFGFLLTKAAGLGDVRQIGSGSIGATNVLRTGNKKLAAATVLLDAAKGTVAVVIAAWLLPQAIGFAAIGAIIGHCFPAWLRFRGGKGFATAAGVSLALAWPVMLTCAAVWAAVLAISRISSISSMISVVAAPIAAWLLGYPDLVWVFIAIAAIVIAKHHANIQRLMRGKEPRVGSKG